MIFVAACFLHPLPGLPRFAGEGKVGLEQVIRRDLFDFFAVVGAAFVEEVAFFAGEDFDVKPLGFAQFFRVHEVGRVDAEDFQ